MKPNTDQPKRLQDQYLVNRIEELGVTKEDIKESIEILKSFEQIDICQTK
jgi:hypothetical protein